MFFEDNDDVLGKIVERSHELQHSPRGTKWAPWAKDLVKQARAAGRTVNEMFGSYAERLAKYGGGAAKNAGRAVNRAANAVYTKTPENKAYRNMQYHKHIAESKSAFAKGEYDKANSLRGAANSFRRGRWRTTTKEAIAGTANSYKRSAKRKLKNLAEKVSKKAGNASKKAEKAYNTASGKLKSKARHMNDSKGNPKQAEMERSRAMNRATRKAKEKSYNSTVTPKARKELAEFERAQAQNKQTVVANKRRTEKERASAQQKATIAANQKRSDLERGAAMKKDIVSKKNKQYENKYRQQKAERERGQAMEDAIKKRKSDAQMLDGKYRERDIRRSKMNDGDYWEEFDHATGTLNEMTKRDGKVVVNRSFSTRSTSSSSRKPTKSKTEKLKGKSKKRYEKRLKLSQSGITIPGLTGTSEIILHSVEPRFRTNFRR